MEKIIMKREWLGEGIPVLMWKGVPLIKIEEGIFVTAKPIGKGVRTLEIAKRMAKQFSERYSCNASVSNDVEWEKAMCALIKFDFAAKEFVQIHKMDICEVLLLNSADETKHVLAAGNSHKLDEIFNGFISDFDAKGEKQPVKLVFFTIRLDPNLIEVS